MLLIRENVKVSGEKFGEFMKVIFLDFNGVLDTWEEMDKINSDNMLRLKRIVLETGAKIVISSSLKNSYWILGCVSSHLKMIIDELTKEGLEVIGFTPLCKIREEEIISYLNDHPEIDNYVILDDDYEMPLLNEHLVKLPSQMIGSSQRGLEDEHVENAIEILGRLPKDEKSQSLRLVPNND